MKISLVRWTLIKYLKIRTLILLISLLIKMSSLLIKIFSNQSKILMGYEIWSTNQTFMRKCSTNLLWITWWLLTLVWLKLLMHFLSLKRLTIQLNIIFGTFLQIRKMFSSWMRLIKWKNGGGTMQMCELTLLGFGKNIRLMIKSQSNQLCSVLHVKLFWQQSILLCQLISGLLVISMQRIVSIPSCKNSKE